MKLLRFFRAREAGSTLVVGVVTLGVASLLLASYVKLVGNVNRSMIRSLHWNEALMVAEAGIEEAMMNLNLWGKGKMKDTGGWYQSGNYAYVARWFNPDPSRPYQHYYYVFAQTNMLGPTIDAWGYTRLPDAYSSGSPWVVRRIQVTTKANSPYPKGMLAQSFIDMNGNNITTDSYDSNDPNHSTNGRYDSAKAKMNGDVGTNLTLTNSVSVGNANIKGSVATGPGGTISVGPNGYITGTVTHDMNVDFPDVVAPFTSAPGLQPGAGGYTYTLPPGDTMVGSLSMSGSQNILVTGPGKSRLYITGDLSITGNAFIKLATNATLEIYMGGNSAKIAGNGIANPTGKATAVAYYGLPSNRQLDLSGNAEYTGTVYAPSADFTASGGGNNTYDLAGAIVVKSIKLNGHFHLHYDEALGLMQGDGHYTITSWREL
jgi:hypothetical protein